MVYIHITGFELRFSSSGFPAMDGQDGYWLLLDTLKNSLAPQLVAFDDFILLVAQALHGTAHSILALLGLALYVLIWSAAYLLIALSVLIVSSIYFIYRIIQVGSSLLYVVLPVLGSFFGVVFALLSSVTAKLADGFARFCETVTFFVHSVADVNFLAGYTLFLLLTLLFIFCALVMLKITVEGTFYGMTGGANVPQLMDGSLKLAEQRMYESTWGFLGRNHDPRRKSLEAQLMGAVTFVPRTSDSPT